MHIARLVRHGAASRWAAVKDAEVALLDPEVRRDPARVSALLHPAFAEIGRSGALWTREQVVAALADEVGRPQPTTDQWEFRQQGPDLVLVTYRITTSSGRSRHSSLWDIAAATPCLRFHQGTVVPPDGDATQ